MLRTVRALFFMTLLAAAPLLAQGRCEPGDTLDECLERYRDQATYVNEMMAQEWDAFESEPTGVDTGGDSLATSTRDFSPLMALFALLGQSSTEDGTGTVVYNLNFLIPGLAPVGSKNAQLEARVNMQPQISELLRNKLHDLKRDAEVESLKEELGEFADHAIRFTYNHSNNSHGRSFAQYETGYRKLCNAALRMVEWEQEMLTTRMDEARNPVNDLPQGTTLQNMKARRTLLALDRELTIQADEAMSAAGLKSYHQLLDNQPQFHLNAERKFRDPLVGPDQLSIEVTYEWSWVNLNTAMKRCGDDWMAKMVKWAGGTEEEENEAVRKETEECLGKYRSYVDENKDGIEKGYRLSFSGEYIDADGEMIETGLQDLAAIESESARKLVLKAGWSRNLNFSDEPIRLDLAASYEDVSGDPDRQNRGIASLTLTRNVGKMSIPFGIVYANRGEFRDDEIDARLSAHIGLRFKMPDRNGGQ